MHHTLAAVKSQVGGNIDDNSMLLFPHGGGDGATTLPEAFNIYSHDTVPLLLIDVLKPRVSDRHAHKNSRVVDQAVNFAESVKRFFGHRLATSEIRHVDVCRQSPAATVGNGFGDTLGRPSINVGHHRSSAFAGDAQAIGPADAVPAACDHHNFPVQ